MLVCHKLIKCFVLTRLQYQRDKFKTKTFPFAYLSLSCNSNDIMTECRSYKVRIEVNDRKKIQLYGSDDSRKRNFHVAVHRDKICIRLAKTYFRITMTCSFQRKAKANHTYIQSYDHFRPFYWPIRKIYDIQKLEVSLSQQVLLFFLCFALLVSLPILETS